MHRCEDFRERIAEHIIDCEDLAARPEIRSELLLCRSCADFYSESREMMEALSAVDLQIADEQWDAMTHRLRMRIINERVRIPAPRRPRWFARDFGIPALGALAAVLLVTVGLYRMALPVAGPDGPAPALGPHQFIDYSGNLDPVTIDFLEQSELLLRNVMKLEADDAEDLEEARQTAFRHLLSIDQRMEAAADLPPVLTAMGKYESILRDIRNLTDNTAAEDIIDIQSRIQKNGLIANMKAFQPTVTVVDVEQ
jgi:hypothetical protein